MLEWCYTLELLGGSTTSEVVRSLHQAQASFTEPWLTLVLAVASILAFYNGLIRRRVTDTLGQALMTLAMMAAGLWVIADPLGTVGAVGQWANQASFGTLGAVAQGTPTNAPRTLGDSMRALFAGAIEMPWCYLEFGNVHWCSDPALLEPRLHKAALSIAAAQQATLSCRPNFLHQSCEHAESAPALTIEHSAELVREANTNGELFLAFPANGPERNSVKEASSLLHVLCQTNNDKKCAGPTAAEAEFRSDGGTFPRMIGVVLIAGGVLGMVVLFGLVALHLLAAAVVSLFMLLLAPVAVLAPALGDGGRAVFAGWFTRLLGAVTSKLLFSFLLGALLTMQRIVMSLELLGWWTQWLLISAFWWAVFFKRHQAMTFLQSRGRQPISLERNSIGRRIGGAIQTYGAMRHPKDWVKSKILPPVPITEQLQKRGHGERDSKSKKPNEQKGPVRGPHTVWGHQGKSARRRRGHRVSGSEDRPGRLFEHQSASGKLDRGAPPDPRVQAILLAKQEQLGRVRGARRAAYAVDDERRAAKLGARERRIESELASALRIQAEEPPAASRGERVRRKLGSSGAGNEREQHTGQVDSHAGVPGGSQSQGVRGRSDRELAVRRKFGTAGSDAGGSFPAFPNAKQHEKERELDPSRERRMPVSNSSRSTVKRSASDFESSAPSRRDQAGDGESSVAAPGARGRVGEPKSRVMDDARAVAERRKRQLGYGPNP